MKREQPNSTDKKRPRKKDNEPSQRARPPRPLSRRHPPSRKPNFDVIRASDLPHQDPPGHGFPQLRLIRIPDKHSCFLRFPTDKLVRVTAHYLPVDGRKLPFLCNGDPCAACMAGIPPVNMSFLWVVDVIAQDHGVLMFPTDGGALSISAQLRRIWMEHDYIEIVAEIMKRNGRFIVRILNDLPEDDIPGDDVLDMILDGEEPSLEEFLGLVEHLDNRDLLAAFPDLAKMLRLRHSGVDIDAL